MTVTLQTVEETLSIEGVNPKPNAKFKTAGGVFLGDSLGWANVADGVDMTVFQKGQSIKVKRLIKENGERGNIIEVLGGAVPAKSGDFSFSGGAKSKYVDQSTSMKLGGLFHDAAQVAGAIIVAQGLDSVKALATFDTVLEHIVRARQNQNV